MSETIVEAVPEEFEPFPEGLGFVDSLQPMYHRLRGKEMSLGLVVGEQHRNLMGICHGGVLMTLADITAATGVNVMRGTRAGTPTINLSLDFIAPARMGQWIQADNQQISLKRRFGFCSGVISNSEGIVARFNGTFYLPEHQGIWKGKELGDGLFPGSDDSSG